MSKKKEAAPAFLKRQILKMPEFAKRRDLLSVLLQDGEFYTLEQVRSLLQKKNFNEE